MNLCARLCVAYLLAATAASADGGTVPTGDSGPSVDSGADAGADSGAAPECTSSGQCAFPTPYCHPNLNECVECLGDQNCANSTGRCDPRTGRCTTCASDADCYPEAPYCNPEFGGCVECLTDRNCGEEGVRCLEGRCGACGDGVCSSRETINSSGFFVDDPVPVPGGVAVGGQECPEDCLSLCPGTDLGSRIASPVARGNIRGGRNLLTSPFCGGESGLDVTFRWTAPRDGIFVFDTAGSDYDTLLYVSKGSCDETPLYCSDDTEDLSSQLSLRLTEGEAVIIVLDSFMGSPQIDGHWLLNVRNVDDESLPCDLAACAEQVGDESPCCVPFDPGACGINYEFGCDYFFEGSGGFGAGGFTGGGGMADPGTQQRCARNAMAGDSPICANAAPCVCGNCAQLAEDCRVIPGCPEVFQCMENNGCSGVECDAPSLCRNEFGRFGGLGGPAFRGASALQSCASASGCAVKCPNPGDAGQGGTQGSDAGMQSPCDPGDEQACDCSNAQSGIRICREDGNGFGRCVCIESDGGGAGGVSGNDGGPEAARATSGGCGCRAVGPSGPASNSAAFALAAAVLLFRRRAKHASHA